MVTIRGGSFTNEDLRQAKELADTVAQNTAANLGQDSRARRQEALLSRYTPDYKPQVQVAARGLLGGYDPDFGEEMGTEVFSPQGVANTVPIVNMPSLDPGEAAAQIYRETGPSLAPQGISSLGITPAGKASSMPPQNLIDQMNPTGVAGIAQGILGSLTGSSPAIYNLTDEYGDPLGGDNFGLGRKFDNPDTARRLGFIPVGRDAAGNIVYDLDPAIKASQERQERDSRLDDERRERAAMLAAQQQQPVDPCPEGYRMDPVTKVCVPVDDTTEPEETTPRTYDTMTRPEPNYTPATNFNIPAITLPDILTGN
jgi:hypothetical protein